MKKLFWSFVLVAQGKAVFVTVAADTEAETHEAIRVWALAQQMKGATVKHVWELPKCFGEFHRPTVVIGQEM